jgi:DNA invertase Pin-like site-specific DNA recombinase
VVITRLDRAFRDTKDALYQVDTWIERGIQLHVLDLGGNTINFGTPIGRLMLTVLVAFGEFERSMARERTRLAMAKIRRKGGRSTSTPDRASGGSGTTSSSARCGRSTGTPAT